MTKQITCEEFTKYVWFYLEGKLDFIQEKRFDQHKKACPKCNELSSDCFAKRTKEEGFDWILRGNRRERKEKQYCLDHDTISEYAKGELVEEESEKVKTHIAGCSFCGRLAQAMIRVLKAGGGCGERVSIIDRLRELLVQLKERNIQSLPPLIQTIFYPGREKICLSDLFGVSPSFVSPATLSSGETISSTVKKVKVPRLLEIGYSPEVEILLYKSDTGWVIRLDFTSLVTPKPFSVILRGKGLHEKVVKVEFDIARFEIPFQVPLKNIWIQI